MNDDNNDDLQNAINGIVNDAGAAKTPAGDTATSDEPDLGMPPVPPMPENLEPEMSLPTINTDNLMNTVPEPIEAQADAEPALNVPEKAPKASGLSDVKKSMIQDLIPLMDKVNISAEKKFSFYKELIDENGDTSMVAQAYEAAKGIADDTAKAEALLYLIDKSE